MAKGKKRVAAVAVEKYVPSFGSRIGQKRRKLSSETQSTNREVSIPATKVACTASNSTQEEVASHSSPYTSGQLSPSTQENSNSHQPSSKGSTNSNQPSTHVDTSSQPSTHVNNHTQPSTNLNTITQPSNAFNTSSQPSTHVNTLSQPSTNSNFQTAPSSCHHEITFHSKQTFNMEESSASPGESHSVLHNIQGEIKTSSPINATSSQPATHCSPIHHESIQQEQGLPLSSPAIQQEPLSCPAIQQEQGVPLPSPAIQQEQACTESTLSCPAIQQEKGCTDSPLCTEEAGEGKQMIAAAMPRVAAAPPPAGQIHGKSARPKDDEPTQHEGLQGIITELSLLNEYILKSKRELEKARAQYMWNRP